MERRKRAMVSDQLETKEDKKMMRKGLWSPDEDERLYSHITHYGVGTWSSVAELAGRHMHIYNKYLYMYLLYICVFVLAAGLHRVIGWETNKAFNYLWIYHCRAEEEREKLQTEMDELSAARSQQGAHLQAGRGPHRIIAETPRKQVAQVCFRSFGYFDPFHASSVPHMHEQYSYIGTA